jgi:hypothetical protein
MGLELLNRRSIPTELHGQTDLRLEIMNYILNVINILVYINSASNHILVLQVLCYNIFLLALGMEIMKYTLRRTFSTYHITE